MFSDMFSGSIVAIVTPMFEQGPDAGSVDYQSFYRLIDWHIEQETQAIVVMGTTGESASVLEAEYWQVIEACVSHVAGRVAVIAGTGAIGTEKTILQTQKAERLGVDGTLVVTPYYCKPTQEGLYQHFKAVAEATKLPIILYNVPARTCSDLLPETVGRLAEIDNIVAIKEATGDISRVGELIAACHTPIQLLSGDDATALEFMQQGGHGVISVTANVAPKLMSKMCQLSEKQSWQQASAINEKLSMLNEKLFVEANPIPVKWALAKMSKIEQGIRLPLTVLSSQYHLEIYQALEQANVEL